MTTPPGTELSYGDTATVEVETFRVDADDDEPGIAEWTVTSVEPGADTGSEMFAPYRISITLTAVTDLSGSFLLPSIDFEGLDAEGRGHHLQRRAGVRVRDRHRRPEGGRDRSSCAWR